MSDSVPKRLDIDPDAYCCIELVRAEKGGYIVTASGGVWLSDRDPDSRCCSGLPKVLFCPFCGATIVSVKHEYGWSWHTVPRRDSPVHFINEGGESNG